MKKTFMRVTILTLALIYFFAGIRVITEAVAGGVESPTEYEEEKLSTKCRSIGPITREECFVDEEGNPVRGFEIEDPQIGDIFLTSSTHSLGWRHGHVAIVVGTDPLKTVEAVALGQKSRIIENPMWERYTTFAQLRLKEEFGGAEKGAEAAAFAVKELTDCAYGFLCSKDYESCSTAEDKDKYHCAHLVWRAYKEIGIDIDSDGGRVVTPFDIYNCDSFEKVIIFGIVE